MKRNIIASTVIASALVSCFASAETVKGGTIDFEGSVTNGTCAVDSTAQTVQLGDVRVADFKKAGDSSAPREFLIKLIDCDSAITTSAVAGTKATAAISFSGVQDKDKDGILALTGPGSARGLGIAITDSTTNKPVTLDNTLGTARTIHNGANDISFSAKYVATSAPVTAGKANATVSFSVTYE